MDSTLTARQAQILELIRDHIGDTGYPPTRAEIARTLGFRSANAAEDDLRALEPKGFIEVLPGTSRGIRLLETGEDGLPLIGHVAAGHPVLAEENVEEYLPVNPDLFSPRADYLLRVRGDSMVDAGIHDRDLLAVQRTHEARNGQVVVARLDDEVTVKRFRRQRNKVWLVPENEQFEPIEVRAGEHELVIEGIGVGIIRRERLG